MENTHNFFAPKNNLIGVGSLKDLSNELLNWKLSKVLLVTDKNLISAGWVAQVEKLLKRLFIFYDIFDGVLHTNPTVAFIEDGLAYFPGELSLKRDYHLIISLGGGTVHDCAKGIAAVAANGGSIIDYEGYNKLTKPALPHIAISTTNSGAEVSMYAVITDESRKVKMTIGSPNIVPHMSVNDPLLHTTMPPEITAESGIDAFGHALEAYVSTEASPISDFLALGAIKLVISHLRSAYENGDNLKAREQMMYAGVMAGMAFNSAGVGYSHALGHQLGGYYSQLHGHYEGILLPHIFRYNAVAVPQEKIFRLAETMALPVSNSPKTVDNIFDALRTLCGEVGIPDGLRKMGVQQDDLPTLAKNALKDIAAFTNPRRGTVEDVKNIFECAM